MMAIHAQVLHLNSDPGAADTARDALKAVPKDASAGGKPHPQVAYHLPRLRQIAGPDA